MTTTFFTACDHAYWPFIAPYATAVLMHNDDALVEIAVEDVARCEGMFAPALQALRDAFPERFHLRGGTFRDRLVNAVRFLEEPECKSEYVYIGDIDILILEGGIEQVHRAKLAQTGLPYSNVIRPDTQRLTGLHFTRSAAHYPVIMPAGIDLRRNDEATLYALVAARHPLPDPNERWRPIHGIHLSLNRRPVDTTRPGWGIHERWIEPYVALWRDERWLAMAPHFHPAFQMLLAVLEATMQARYPDREIYRYRDVQRLWHEWASNEPATDSP